MRSFRGTTIVSEEDLQPSILSTELYIFLTLEFAATYFANIFKVLYTSYCESNSLSKQFYFQRGIDYIKMRAATFLKQLLFDKKNFFRTPSFLEWLLFPNSYFLVTNTFSDQLPLQGSIIFRHSQFFRRIIPWEELFLSK